MIPSRRFAPESPEKGLETPKANTSSRSPNSGLWGFLAAWRSLFDRFDEDRSGYISFSEYSNALVAFGYRLTSTFVSLLYRTYEKNGNDRMSFDLFVQSCIVLKRMTDVFKRYDDDRDGYITLGFEEFLTGETFPLLVVIFFYHYFIPIFLLCWTFVHQDMRPEERLICGIEVLRQR